MEHAKTTLFCFALAVAFGYACTVPYENMRITASTTLCTGTYYLNDTGADGSIILSAPGIALDCNGSELVGSMAANSIAIYSAHQSNTTIENCIINGGYAYGILSRGDMNNSFINNTFTGTYARTYGTLYLQRDFGYNVINNTFNNTNSKMIISDEVAGNGNLTLMGNYFHNTSDQAVRMDQSLCNLTVLGNTFDNVSSSLNPMGSIVIDNALIENNTFIGTAQTFIQGANISYKNNRHYNGSAIIHVSAFSSRNFTATGNYFENIFYSTCVNGSDRCEAIKVLNTSNSLFAGNTFINVSDGKYAEGIDVSGSNILVTNNSFTAVSSAAHTTGCEGCAISSSNVTFSFNTVNMTDADSGYSHGISLWCTNNSQTFNNTLFGGRFVAILEYGTYNSSIHDNSITDSTIPIYDLHGPHDNAIYNNYITQSPGGSRYGAISLLDNISNERIWNNTYSGSRLQLSLQTANGGWPEHGNITNISVEENQPIQYNISVDNMSYPGPSMNISFSFTGNTSSMQIFYSRSSPADTLRAVWNYSGPKSFIYDNQTLNFTNLQLPYNDIENATGGNLIATDVTNYSMLLASGGTWQAYVGDYFTPPLFVCNVTQPAQCINVSDGQQHYLSIFNMTPNEFVQYSTQTVCRNFTLTNSGPISGMALRNMLVDDEGYVMVNGHQAYYWPDHPSAPLTNDVNTDITPYINTGAGQTNTILLYAQDNHQAVYGGTVQVDIGSGANCTATGSPATQATECCSGILSNGICACRPIGTYAENRASSSSLCCSGIYAYRMCSATPEYIPPPATCGNRICNIGEDCSNCPRDCGCKAGVSCALNPNRMMSTAQPRYICAPAPRQPAPVENAPAGDVNSTPLKDIPLEKGFPQQDAIPVKCADPKGC